MIPARTRSAPAPRRREAELGRDGERAWWETTLRGAEVLRHPLLNKGAAFDRGERDALGLHGLLPPAITTLEDQVTRALASVRAQSTAIGKHQMLRAIQDRNETLFAALLSAHVEELLPIVYTPTVGEAIERFDQLHQEPRGLVIGEDDLPRLDEILDAWPHDDVRIAVVTDASAILGIGDRGHGGIGISIGKLALYGLAGIGAHQMLPVLIDAGTDREALREDPLYLGARKARLRGARHLALVDAVAHGIARRFPRAILQWEDLAKDVAIDVLARHRATLPSFNDDVQGTGAVTLAGMLAACASKGERLGDQRIVVSGAGAGGAGVARALRAGMEREGLSREEARARVLVLDSRGLLVAGDRMDAYKAELAQDRDAVASWVGDGRPDLLQTIVSARATAIVGLSGQPGTFDEKVVRAVADNTAHPIVLALSNPISACEARPADVLEWTEGRAIVATGSPFAPVVRGDEQIAISQGNNAFVFPGLGLGALCARATAITDAMVLEAAYALAAYVDARHLENGAIYPPVRELREVAVHVAARVMTQAVRDGVGTLSEEVARDPIGHARRAAALPRYLEVRPA